jgi:hypothetical protein
MFWEKYKVSIHSFSHATPAVQVTKYEKLSEHENLAEDRVPSLKHVHATGKFIPGSKINLTWLVAAGLSVVVIALVTIIPLRAHAHHSGLKRIPWTNCGTTPDEARSHGCVYEPMQRAWIPPECYFPDAVDDYDLFRDRQWFQDENLTIPSNTQRLESGDELLAYTRYWHDEHCTYVFRKLALAVDLRKTLVNRRLANIRHSTHCAKTIAKRIVNSYNESFLGQDKSYTESILAFESCVQIYA